MVFPWSLHSNTSQHVTYVHSVVGFLASCLKSPWCKAVIIVQNQHAWHSLIRGKLYFFWVTVPVMDVINQAQHAFKKKSNKCTGHSSLNSVWYKLCPGTSEQCRGLSVQTFSRNNMVRRHILQTGKQLQKHFSAEFGGLSLMITDDMGSSVSLSKSHYITLLTAAKRRFGWSKVTTRGHRCW